MKFARSLLPKLLLILGACALDNVIDLARLWPFALAATVVAAVLAWSGAARPGVQACDPVERTPVEPRV